MPRKRAIDEAALDETVVLQDDAAKDPDTLSRLRNMWQFACFMQYLQFFGSVVKIDESLDMDELEEICLFPEKVGKLADLGLALLKYVSSHRGLTPEIFDEYTRRQYMAKAPSRNPFGEDEEPNKFSEFDVFTKIKVLHQLSIWTLGNADRIRSQMPERDSEQTDWRMDPYGFDREGRAYFLLDDNRLYRRTDAPMPPTPIPAKAKPKPKAKSKMKPRAKGTRASKRIRVSSHPDDSESELDSFVAEDPVDSVATEAANQPAEDDDFGGMKWECVAITMDEYQDFLESIRRSRDPDEKELYKDLTASIIPLLEKQAEAQRQKMLKRQRELENLQKMATAKRSSRLADKQEKQKEMEEAAAAERKRVADLAMARKEQQRQQQMDDARQSRMQTREQRLREREVRRILHEEELAKLQELDAQGASGDARFSSRNLKNELERHQKELDSFKDEEEKWVFDCAGCGLYGENIDDGAHSVACERCNIWQHSKCNGIDAADAEREDFHFVCSDCKRKEEEAKRPKIPPLKLGRITSSPQTDTSDNITLRTDPVEPSPSSARIVEGVSLLKSEPHPMPRPSSGSETRNVEQLQPRPPNGHYPPGHYNSSANARPAVNGFPMFQPNQHAPVPSPQPGPFQAGGAAGIYRSPAHLQTHNHIHANAHQSHMPSSPYGAYPANGFYATGAPPQRPAPDHSFAPSPGFNRTPTQDQPKPQSSYMGSFKGFAPVASPTKKQQTPSPILARQGDPGSPYPALPPINASAPVYRNFSPPADTVQQQAQRLAGHSPVKQPSPSPRGSFQGVHIPQSSPAMAPPPAATPAPHVSIAPPMSSPATSLLPATPQAVSSPIPPVGNGPVIPQKHDATRPGLRDHAAEVPVFPPKTSLSPSWSQTGKGMDVRPGEGGLGTGNIPVKKMPDQLTSPLQPTLSSPPSMQPLWNNPRPAEDRDVGH